MFQKDCLVQNKRFILWILCMKSIVNMLVYTLKDVIFFQLMKYYMYIFYISMSVRCRGNWGWPQVISTKRRQIIQNIHEWLLLTKTSKMSSVAYITLNFISKNIFVKYRVRNLKFATYLKFVTCGNTNKINECRWDLMNVQQIKAS